MHVCPIGTQRTLAVWCCFWINCLTSVSPILAQQNSSTSTANPLRNVFADYAAEIRGSDGRVDTDALLARLTNLGVGTYCWLIWHASTDWDDLQLFLPKASQAGLRVWVYLVPPSESPPHTSTYSEPFRLDFGQWGEQIAQLSLTYTNLAAWVIDDFYTDCDFFTPDYIRGVQSRAKAVNPKLAFLPLMYFPQVTPSFVEYYSPSIDGVLAAYPTCSNDIAQARAILNCTYSTNVFRFPANTRSYDGQFVMASQTARVLATNKATVCFREFDDFTGPTRGYHFRQFLVDGAVVWEADIADHTNVLQDISFDITPQVQGKTNVVVAFRLLDKLGVYNFGVTWSVTDLQTSGLQLQADLTQPQQWQVSSQGAFSTGFGPAPQVQARPRPFMVMETGNEGDFRMRHGDPVTDDRFRDFLSMSLKAWDANQCDGIVTYCLDKSAQSLFYARTRKMFQSYQGNLQNLWQH